MSRSILLLSLPMLLFVALRAQDTADENFAAAMHPIVGEYMKLCDVLAADNTEGVAEAAKRIGELAATLQTDGITGAHARYYKTIPQRIQSGAQKVAAAKGLETIRNVLSELSKPIVLWATLAKPAGIKIMYCSMKPGSWLQKDTVLRNPYYGSQMLHCGEIISD